MTQEPTITADEFDLELEYVGLRRVTRAGRMPDATTTLYLKRYPERLPAFVRVGRNKVVHRDIAREWVRRQLTAQPA